MNVFFISYMIVEGKLLVDLEKAEIVKQTTDWKNAFVLHVVGDTPTYTYA